jgi:hypothetical protein
MDNKKMLMIGGLVAVAAGAYWYMNKDKGTSTRLGDPSMGDMDMGDMGDMNDTPSSPSPISYNNTFTVNNSLGNGKYKWFGVESSGRTKFDLTAQIGTQAVINGNQPCTISDFWIDASGKRAAFKCEEIAEGNYDIPSGSRLQY